MDSLATLHHHLVLPVLSHRHLLEEHGAVLVGQLHDRPVAAELLHVRAPLHSGVHHLADLGAGRVRPVLVIELHMTARSSAHRVVQLDHAARADHRHVAEAQVAVRLEVHRHVEEVVLVLHERVQDVQHERLREPTREAAPARPPVGDVLQHEREPRVLARAHLREVDDVARVVHVLLRLLSREHARVDRLRLTSRRLRYGVDVVGVARRLVRVHRRGLLDGGLALARLVDHDGRRHLRLHRFHLLGAGDLLRVTGVGGVLRRRVAVARLSAALRGGDGGASLLESEGRLLERVAAVARHPRFGEKGAELVRTNTAATRGRETIGVSAVELVARQSLGDKEGGLGRAAGVGKTDGAMLPRGAEKRGFRKQSVPVEGTTVHRGAGVVQRKTARAEKRGRGVAVGVVGKGAVLAGESAVLGEVQVVGGVEGIAVLVGCVAEGE